MEAQLAKVGQVRRHGRTTMTAAAAASFLPLIHERPLLLFSHLFPVTIPNVNADRALTLCLFVLGWDSAQL